MKWQKRLYKRLHDNAFAHSGRTSSLHHTQGDAQGYVLVAPSGRTSSLHHTHGDALGYVLVAPSGRALNAYAYPMIQLAKLELKKPHVANVRIRSA